MSQDPINRPASLQILTGMSHYSREITTTFLPLAVPLAGLEPMTDTSCRPSVACSISGSC